MRHLSVLLSLLLTTSVSAQCGDFTTQQQTLIAVLDEMGQPLQTAPSAGDSVTVQFFSFLPAPALCEDGAFSTYSVEGAAQTIAFGTICAPWFYIHNVPTIVGDTTGDGKMHLRADNNGYCPDSGGSAGSVNAKWLYVDIAPSAPIERLIETLVNYGRTGTPLEVPGDMTMNGKVDVADLLNTLRNWE